VSKKRVRSKTRRTWMCESTTIIRARVPSPKSRPCLRFPAGVLARHGSGHR
jgi:hypothetical protein